MQASRGVDSLLAPSPDSTVLDNTRSAALLSRHLQSKAKLYVSWGSRIGTVLATVTAVTYGPEFRAGVSALCKCLSEYRLARRWGGSSGSGSGSESGGHEA
jgi:hypothetical protein